jgi:hypothetical protein
MGIANLSGPMISKRLALLHELNRSVGQSGRSQLCPDRNERFAGSTAALKELLKLVDRLPPRVCDPQVDFVQPIIIPGSHLRFL